MKKVMFILILFNLFFSVALAEEVKIGLNEKYLINNSVSVKKDEIIEVPIYYQTEDYDLYGFQADLVYDDKIFELVDYKPMSNFEFIVGKRVIAYRLDLDSKDNLIGVLKFKVLNKGISSIELKNIQVANADDYITLDDMSLNVNAKASVNIVLIIGVVLGVVIIFCSIFFLFFIKQKKNLKKEHRKRKI